MMWVFRCQITFSRAWAGRAHPCMAIWHSLEVAHLIREVIGFMKHSKLLSLAERSYDILSFIAVCVHTYQTTHNMTCSVLQWRWVQMPRDAMGLSVVRSWYNWNVECKQTYGCVKALWYACLAAASTAARTALSCHMRQPPQIDCRKWAQLY